jgi:hypothetical protein
MGQTNAQLSDALKRLSAAKYGKSRAQVEKDIFTRLGAAEAEKKAKAEQMKKTQQQRMTGMNNGGAGSSFLDEWLAKRNNIGSSGAAPAPTRPMSTAPASISPTPTVPPVASSGVINPSSIPPMVNSPTDSNNPFITRPAAQAQTPTPPPVATPEENGLHLRGDNVNHDSEISIKLR